MHVHHPFWLGKRGLRLAKRRALPVVFTYHTRLERYTHYVPLPGLALKNLAAHFLIKRFANQCDAIITPPPSTEEYLRNLGVSTLVETIPTGIDMQAYARWKQTEIDALRGRYVTANERLLVSVSRLAKEKNLDFLIEALLKTRQQTGTPFKCVLIGDGPEKSRLTEKVAHLGLADTIFFAGSIPPEEVPRYYLAADAFVFASTSETQGMVLVEAMAGGCPVVAVRASGVYDVIHDGYNGFAVTEAIDAWAAALSELLKDPKCIRSMAHNAREFAADYASEKITERITRLYRRVIAINHSRAVY
ncbi:MAG: glycosyltransferase [Thiotrichales bacterium]